MAYVARAHLAASAIVPSSDYNQGMDNEAYLKSEHDLATPAAINAGWRQDGFTWTYVSASLFGISGQSPSLIYQKGTRIRWKDGGAFKYGVSVCSSGSRFAFTGGSDYSASSGQVVTDNYYSHEVSPYGYPDWFTWNPAITGYSTCPAAAYASYRFRMEGNTVFMAMSEDVDGGHPGVSNATTKTYSLPVVAKILTGGYWSGITTAFKDNNATAYYGIWLIPSGASVLSVYRANLATWTTSGNCACFAIYGCGVMPYEA